MKKQSGLWIFRGKVYSTLGAALRAAWPDRRRSVWQS